MSLSATTRTRVEFEEVVDKQDAEKTKLKKLLNMSVNEIGAQRPRRELLE